MSLVIKLYTFAVVVLNSVQLGSALTCKKEGIFGISSYITCPQSGQPSTFTFCCGSEENRYCCENIFGDIQLDKETVDKIVEKDSPALAYMYVYDYIEDAQDQVALPLQPKHKRRSFFGFGLHSGVLTPSSVTPDTSTYKRAVRQASSGVTAKTTTVSTEIPLTPEKVNENEGIISDAARKAKDKIKDKVKDKIKTNIEEKVTDVALKTAQKNLPRIIGILVGVVLVVLVVCVVCCCCCPFCLLAKRRQNRGRVVRGETEVTVTVPAQQQAAAQPLQPCNQPQPYIQPQQQYYPQPYPPQPGYPGQQPYPGGPAAPMPGYPVGVNPYVPVPMPMPAQYDQPPPYVEKQPAFNPNYGAS